MLRTEKIWEHADAAFKKANEAFAEADKVFEEADKVFEEAGQIFKETTKTGSQSACKGTHHVHFVARTGAERWRLTCRFFKLAFTILFTGKTELHFKAK